MSGMEKPRFLPGDSVLIENIVNYLKAKGIFDEFRHECLADVDTKSSCQNLSQRVDGYTTKFLANETWHPDLNKNELRNKLRRHIDESGMLAVGADHVVEQVINPKIGQLFFPRIREVVHQYLNEENLKLNKKQDPIREEPTVSEKNFAESTDSSSSSKAIKSTVLDPIADILAFSYSKPTKTDNTGIKQTVPNPPVIKTENVQPKYPDAVGKQEKRKEEKNVSQCIKTEQEKKKEEKNVSQFVKTEPIESTSEASVTPTAVDSKPQIESKESSTKVKKEIKAEEWDASKDTLEAQKKCQKEDIKLEKKKTEDAKIQNNDVNLSEEIVSNKSLNTTPQKSNVSIKIKSDRTDTDKYSKSDRSESDKHNKFDRTDMDKHKQKLKTTSSHKSSSNSSKAKSKETTDSSKHSSEKSGKSTPSKSLKHSTKDQSSPLKSGKSSKDEKNVVSGLKLKSSDGNIKTGEPSSKKLTSSKSGTPKKDNLVVKPKSGLDKAEKHKNVKDQKSDNLRSDSSSNIEKGSKSSYPHSSSYESSQGSDQERGSLVSTKERQKLFSKHFKKDSPVQKDRDKSDKKVFSKKRLAEDDARLVKKHKEKNSKLFTLEEKQKESSTFQDSSKLGSRSDSFGSGSSLTNSPTTSKENSLSTFEESNENSSNKHTEKKKKHNKEKCHSPQILPPPPPPPPSSGSLICGTPSSAEMSSLDDTQSSSESENSDSEDSDERSNVESETNESTSCSIKNAKKAIDFGEKATSVLKPHNQSLQSDNSSSEFEGFCSSPEKEFQSSVQPLDSDVSVSSVHTSELSTFEDELTDDESSGDENAKSQKMKLTVKEAREKILMKAKLGYNHAKKSTLSSESKKKQSNCSLQSPVLYASSEDESSVPAEPKRELRRERKLNPKYASNEYTSIFNSRKSSFITRTPEEYERKEINSESNRKKSLNAPVVNAKLTTERKSSSRLSVELKNKSTPESDSDECSKISKSDHKITLKSFAIDEQSDLENLSDSENSSSKEKLDLNNIDDDYLSDNDNSRGRLKIKTANKCYNQRDLNSRPTKRKADSVIESSNKRPCSRNSVDSCSSEFAANENKPFNNERISSGTSSSSNKSHRISNDFKDSTDIRDNRKKDHKQRTNNNGDLLSKREMLRNNSHSKLHHTSGRKPDGDFKLIP
ncbi:Biorientation of chromosomes in cell division protein 1-like protein, partial [Stegodyphus mimosarum]